MPEKEIKTDFYDAFRCLASECPITCCKEWKIAIDEDTCTKWTKQQLSDYLTEKDGSMVIHLNNAGECPFLTQQKLCKLVQKHGEGILSKTCRDFPRQIHEFEDRIEFSLTSCCPAVIDLLEKKKEIMFCGRLDKAKTDGMLKLRSRIIRCVQNPSYTIEKAFLMGFYLLLKAEKAVSHKKEEIEELAQALDNMEYSGTDTFLECNELFLDITENYRKQGIYRDFLEELIQMSEQYEENSQKDLKRELTSFEEFFATYENLLRNFLVSELYGQLLLPDYDWEDMVIAMQWIGMEYVVIRQSLFLSWKIEKKLTYEKVRETIVYIARMTGYDAADIREYFGECFESMIWEWGYFAFMMGNTRRKK